MMLAINNLYKNLKNISWHEYKLILRQYQKYFLCYQISLSLYEYIFHFYTSQMNVNIKSYIDSM